MRAKAADGKRLHALALDEPAAAAVRQIFEQFIGGRGLFAIAEHLTREGIASPSAHDPARNRHRCGIAWSKSAVRTILLNPHYTGRQVWNKQRKDEVLIDVNDVALGHTTRMRWNEAGHWIYSEDITHPPIVSPQTFARAQQVLAGRRRTAGPRERMRTRHAYALGGLFACGLCDRKMQAHWPMRWPTTGAVSPPRNVFVRENEVLPALDAWLSKEFAPHPIEETIEALAAAEDLTGHHQALAQAHTTIRDCEGRMTRYRAAIDAGGDLQEITQWIDAAKAQRTQAEAALRTMPAPAIMTREDVRAMIGQFASLAAVIGNADPADKAEIYRGLNLMLTYQPTTQTVRAEARLTVDSHGVMVGVRGPTRTLRT